MLLDHLYEPKGSKDPEVATLKTKVDNLSNITVKNNLSNQILPQQKINAAPTDPQHIVRKNDIDQRYKRVVNMTTGLTGDNTHSWAIPDLEDNKLHNFIFKLAFQGFDITFGWNCFITSKNWKNMGPTLNFGSDNNSVATDKSLKIWIENGKMWVRANFNIFNSSIFLYKESFFT